MAYPLVKMKFFSPLEGSDLWRSVTIGEDNGAVTVTHWEQIGNEFLVSDTKDNVVTEQPTLAEDLGWDTP